MTHPSEADSPPERRPDVPPCPFCGTSDTELSNTFGAHASVSSWWCRRCRSPFEAFKWGNHPEERRRDDE